MFTISYTPRFGNYLRNNCLAQANSLDLSVIELATKAIARLTQVSGTYTADESTCITESCTDDDLDGIPDDCQEPDCPADLNGDATVSAADITTLLQAWATAGGDLNGDGTTSAADITVLLQSWGSCSG